MVRSASPMPDRFGSCHGTDAKTCWRLPVCAPVNSHCPLPGARQRAAKSATRKAAATTVTPIAAIPQASRQKTLPAPSLPRSAHAAPPGRVRQKQARNPPPAPIHRSPQIRSRIKSHPPEIAGIPPLVALRAAARGPLPDGILCRRSGSREPQKEQPPA